MAPGPTVAAMQLGVSLRRLREAKKMNQAAGARVLGASPAKISRIESGKSQVEQEDVTRLLDLYGMTEQAATAHSALAEQRAELLGLAELSCMNDYWTELSHLLDPPVRHLLALEAEAHLITTYESQAIPPMLQTDAYARAVALAISPDDLQWRGGLGLRVLSRRRGVLKTLDAPVYWALIQESALRRSPFGDPAVMQTQLITLRRQATERKITIQIVPDNTAMALIAPGPFTLLRFHHPDVPSVVLHETITTIRSSWVRPEVDACHLVFNSLATKALTPEASLELITRLIDQMPTGPGRAGGRPR